MDWEKNNTNKKINCAKMEYARKESLLTEKQKEYRAQKGAWVYNVMTMKTPLRKANMSSRQLQSLIARHKPKKELKKMTPSKGDIHRYCMKDRVYKKWRNLYMGEHVDSNYSQQYSYRMMMKRKNHLTEKQPFGKIIDFINKT